MTHTQTKYSSAFLDQHRDINVQDDWWDNVYEEFCEKMIAAYIFIDYNTRGGRRERHIWFSGFWSQGDGACFDGQISTSSEFIRHHSLEKEFPWMVKACQTYAPPTVSWSSNGRYSHKYTLSFEIDVASFDTVMEELYDGDEFINSVAEADRWDQKYSDEVEAFNDAVKAIVHGYCDELYEALEEEYEYQTSDEAVAETLEANGIEEPVEEEA